MGWARAFDIRHAEIADADTIADIYNESVHASDATMDAYGLNGPAMAKRLQQLTDREVMLVLVDPAKEVVGWGVVQQYSSRFGYRYTCETSLYLRRSLAGRRLGLGTRLQNELVNYCRSFEYHHVVARILADNRTSIDLHEKFGFQLVGIQHEVGRLGGGWRDVAIYELLLAPGRAVRSDYFR